MTRFEYEWLPCHLVRQKNELIEEMCKLYSEHYGIWSSSVGPPLHPGAPVRLALPRMVNWLQNVDSKVAFARMDSALIGYAIAVQAKLSKGRMVSWVTQLVVHQDYRTLGVGKELLHSMWSFSDHFAWGLLTANPYAVRALEKATRRRCDLKTIKRNKNSIMRFGGKHVPYLDEKVVVTVEGGLSCANTAFFVDHSNLAAMLADVSTASVPWILGGLEEGWEWFAFTFREQDQIALTNQELDKMLAASDQITRQAYARMPMESKAHRWASYTDIEVDFIANYFCGQLPPTALDLGCGNGRHAIELARRGCRVDAVDLASTHLEAAAKRMDKRNPVNFIPGDVREVSLGVTYKLILCLYDVIGSYAENEENDRILKNISLHLSTEGFAFISVMNFEQALTRAVHTFKLRDEPNCLTDLRPSNTMESTGNIFDPNFYLVDTDTRVVYRKEQFSSGAGLPQELLIRDRRFTEDEITVMCRNNGLEVVFSRFVKAGKWDEELSHSDGKEILLVCRKVQ